MKDSVEKRLKDLRAVLTKSWTIFPRKTDSFREPNSWWPITVIMIIMGGITLAALYYDPYSPHNFLLIRPLMSLDQVQPTAPKFVEGGTVRVRMLGTVYAGVDTDRLLEDPPELKSGVILDGIWKQGRWLYQIRFSPTQIGWVGEPDLIPLNQGP